MSQLPNGLVFWFWVTGRSDGLPPECPIDDSRPLGVRGRNSDNRLIAERLGWKPSQSLRSGLEKTYCWVAEQVAAARSELAAAK